MVNEESLIFCKMRDPVPVLMKTGFSAVGPRRQGRQSFTAEWGSPEQYPFLMG